MNLRLRSRSGRRAFRPFRFVALAALFTLGALFALTVLHAPLAFAFANGHGREPVGRPAVSPPSSASAAPAGSHSPAEHPPGPRKPVIALITESGSRGPLVLEPHEGVYAADLTIENDGSEPL